MKVLGVDPGFGGALSRVEIDSNHRIKSLYICDMPITTNLDSKRQIDAVALRLWLQKHPAELAVIERVHSMPNQGVASTFAFGEGYGLVQGLIYANPNTRLIKTPPAVWKATFGLSSDKNKSLDLARQLTDPIHHRYFTRRKDDGRAEAFLLALFGARSLGLDFKVLGGDKSNAIESLY